MNIVSRPRTTGGDDENLYLVGDAGMVDRVNSSFYGSFPYPWQPRNFLYPADPMLYARALAQTIGDWQHRRLPRQPRIWIAGCGTNQAAYLALQFPHAQIVGSDLSATSLALCRKSLDSMGLRNVELRNESLLDAGYTDEFDYVVSTGVIHHTSNPAQALGCLRRALRSHGVLELMVYNRFHRVMNTSIQKSMRLLTGETLPHWDEQLDLLHQVGASLPPGCAAARHFEQFQGEPAARIADSLLQPVEYSYTVETLQKMAAECGLELLSPRISEWDKTDSHTSWNMRWTTTELQDRYDALPDAQRWQITNLLMAEDSPMLWFYLQRNDSPYTALSEHELNAQFLDSRFTFAKREQRCYVLQSEGNYTLLDAPVAASAHPLQEPWQSLAKEIAGGLTPREALQKFGLGDDFSTVTHARLYLTTTAFPFLLSKPQLLSREALSGRVISSQQPVDADKVTENSHA